MLDVVFEDNHLLVVNKPSGVLSQPGKTQDGSIATQVADAYPDATGPLLVHRLDMDTSGLLLLAKTRSVHHELQQLFEQRKVIKHYVAIVQGRLEGLGGIVALPIRADINDRPRQIVCFEHGKPSTTLWQLINQVDGCTRVLFKPVTGRTHQLRVHSAASRGLRYPIVGDRLYGEANGRLKLHAQSLEFEHPVTLKQLKISCKVPF